MVLTVIRDTTHTIVLSTPTTFHYTGSVQEMMGTAQDIEASASIAARNQELRRARQSSPTRRAEDPVRLMRAIALLASYFHEELNEGSFVAGSGGVARLLENTPLRTRERIAELRRLSEDIADYAQIDVENG